jgi:hypothetical protein
MCVCGKILLYYVVAVKEKHITTLFSGDDDYENFQKFSFSQTYRTCSRGR